MEMTILEDINLRWQNWVPKLMTLAASAEPHTWLEQSLIP